MLAVQVSGRAAFTPTVTQTLTPTFTRTFTPTFRPTFTLVDAGPFVAAWPLDSDAGLLAATGRGEVGAFNTLVARHQDFLYSLAVRTVRDPILAEDALQDGLVHAFVHASEFRGDGGARGWMARVVLNACRDTQRWYGRRRADPLPEPPAFEPANPAGDPDRELVAAERARLLEDALGRLPRDQRVALLLHTVHGFGYDEIAMATGVALGTVKSRIHRARLALRELLFVHRDLFAES